MSKMGMDWARLQRARSVDGVLVLQEGARGGMQKIRCPLTHQFAVPEVRADGTTVLRTPTGREYRSRRI